MQITAENLWLSHRAALGGVSGATGAALPATLDEVTFPAVRMSHWGMALVLCRNIGHEDPPIPQGMTQAEADVVLARLDDAGLLPWTPRHKTVLTEDCPNGASC
jgi:hypothetical protein